AGPCRTAGPRPRRLGPGPAGRTGGAGAPPRGGVRSRRDRGNRRRAGRLRMGVTVYVMPLATWLTGSFQSTWGEGRGTPMPAGPRLRDEVAARNLDAFKDEVERLLARRPDWDEEGPARAAGVFSAEGFAGPFLLARRWSYR